MELHNLLEDEVSNIINKLLKDKEDICTCDKCKLDIAAIALNNLKPRYVVTEKGALYGKLDTLDYQFDADLVKEVIKAINIVVNKPHHE
jgi:competence protein ComFB